MSLEVYRTVAEFRAACDRLRARGEKLGLIPTMGTLHAGHLALVDHAKALGATVLVTIFVNPTQFGPQEDFQVYPRSLERDLSLCGSHGAWAAFVPSVEAIYPRGEKTRVRVSGLTDALCGPRRPGHFEGVATVVTKLLVVAGPCVAVFGRKRAPSPSPSQSSSVCLSCPRDDGKPPPKSGSRASLSPEA